ncbi:SigE family RNA polymerase sigma factor [Actinoalloteichus spitiensis]|uniref:SigE family RNA polymerase sigma factor n=1 Tax=Actinoalloteichus spitiensis TaxID=252394 RepID=UPI0003788EF1|nr:SigE family RNA polymerase sigma factor [Actinoalloteichus spitiensis]
MPRGTAHAADRSAPLRGGPVPALLPTGLAAVGENDRAVRDAEFSRYFTERSRGVRATAYLLCGDWQRAEDLLQAAMLKVYLAWPRLTNRDLLDAYTRRVLVRTFLDENRRLWRRRERCAAEVPDGTVHRDDEVEHRMILWSVLATLPARQRAVLVLRYWNDLTVAETARVLGCSQGAVKSHVGRALTRLRARLSDHFPELAATTERRRS